MSLPQYPAYKETGVDWLGKLPKNWTIIPLGRLIQARSGTDKKVEEGAYTLLGANGPIGSTDTASVMKGDILIGRVGSAGALTVVLGSCGVSDNALIVSLTSENLSKQFIYYMLSSLRFDSIVSKTANPLLVSSKLLQVVVALPERSHEQQAIVQFLDRETSRIDALVAEQERLIGLLKEKRQAVISHSVTKGLDPNAGMKDSGSEWLGFVPAHWDVMTAKRVSKVFVPQRNKPELNSDGVGVCWVTMENMSAHEIETSTVWVSDEAARSSGSRVLKAGAVISSCIGNFGSASINKVDVIINQQLQAFRPKESIYAEFLRHLVEILKPYFESIGTAATLVYVNQSGFENMPVVVPPLSEQKAIINFARQHSQQFASLTTEAEKVITLLKERRSALISAAITGKIDVRNLTSAVQEAA